MAFDANLQNTKLALSAGDIRQFPAKPVPQIALSGRSNVGKSSLINTLLGRRSLARVSSAPGKTITVNFYDVDGKLFLVDLPGYGFAKVDKKEKERWGAMMDHYFQDSTLLMHVLLLVDIRHDPTQDDVAMAQYFRQMDIPFSVVATKADKISRGARMKQLAPICRQLLIQPWEVIVSSSEDNTGRDKLLELIDQILEEEAAISAEEISEEVDE